MLKKRYLRDITECGTDEAGRGCLAGPVTAAAVVLPDNFSNKLLNDSKKTSLVNRLLLKEVIETEALSFGVAHIDMEQIDKINILNASILGMHKAIERLTAVPGHIIVDGNKFKPYKKIPHQCIVKGDGKYLSIAAASILAKTYRDAYMERIHEEFPMYGWAKNKGYPTLEHREAIREFGITKYHRKSFRLLPEQLKLGL